MIGTQVSTMGKRAVSLTAALAAPLGASAEAQKTPPKAYEVQKTPSKSPPKIEYGSK